MKRKQRTIIGILLVVAALTAAFWLGDRGSGPRGGAPAPTTPVVQTQTPSPAAASQAPTAAPSQPPVEAASAAPSQTPGTEASQPPAPVRTPETTPEAVPSQPPAPSESTEPAGGGNPEPVAPQDAQITEKTLTCTISISCATILDHMDWLDANKAELVPEDGWLLEPMQVTFYEGESVFHVLRRTCKQQKLHMEFEETPIYNSAYIEGIGNLYEFDCGDLSGWNYRVNGWFPNYGCSQYQLRDGDVIEWLYTCDLGRDVGGQNFEDAPEGQT